MLRASLLVVVSALFAASGCATQFTGEPQYPGGPPACAAQCNKDGLQMSGYVYVGEFSSACVCAPKQSGPAASSASSATDSTGAATAAAAGVILQQQREQQRSQMASMHH